MLSIGRIGVKLMAVISLFIIALAWGYYQDRRDKKKSKEKEANETIRAGKEAPHHSK